jgi:hypothetical protein
LAGVAGCQGLPADQGTSIAFAAASAVPWDEVSNGSR